MRCVRCVPLTRRFVPMHACAVALCCCVLQVIRLPMFVPFVPALRRVQHLSGALRLLHSSLTNPPPAVVTALSALLTAFKLVHQALQPFTLSTTAISWLQAHMKDERALLARKVASICRLYSLSLSELSLGVLEAQASLRAHLSGDRGSIFEGATAAASIAASLQAPRGEFVRPSVAPVAEERESVTDADEAEVISTGQQPNLSSPLHMQDDYFGDSSQSPYAVEKVAAARAREMRELLHTYQEFPAYTPISAGISQGNTSIGSGTEFARGGRGSGAMPVPFCADLFAPSRSPLVLPRDFVPQVRASEFAALQAAFQRLCVNHGSGSNLSSNSTGPRVVFIHGEAGLGGQEYAKFVLHNLLLTNASAAHASSAAAAASAAAAQSAARGPGGIEVAAPTRFSSSSTSSLGLLSPTSPPAYTQTYAQLHFSFTRFGQVDFRRRKGEGLLDALQRKLKRAKSARNAEREAAKSISGDNEGGAAITSTVSSAAPLQEGYHTGPSTAAAAAAAAAAASHVSSSGLSGIPPLEKEKLQSMHRYRSDALSIVKSLLSPLALHSSLLIGAGEWENSAYPSTEHLWQKYRAHVLDTPTILLLSNVHKNDEAEIEKLIFPPSDACAGADSLTQNKAILIIHSRQPLKAVMKRCNNHAISQQLCAMDETQSMNAFLKLSEKRTALRALHRPTGLAVNHTTSGFRPGHSLSPGLTIRFAALMRGSIFLGKFIIRQVEWGHMPETIEAAAGKFDGAPLMGQSSREVAEWVCGCMESKPSSSAAWLCANFFPSSQEHMAPVISWAFLQMSLSAQGLFVAIAYALSGVQSFTWRTLKAVMLHYAIMQADSDMNQQAAHRIHRRPLRPDQLEADLRELLGRGFVELLGELDGGVTGAEASTFSADDDLDEVLEADEAGGADPAAAAGTGSSKSSCTGSPLNLPGSGGAATPAAFSSLLHARFQVHDILKEFGLSIAHAATPASKKEASSTVSSRDFLRVFGPALHAQFVAPETAPKFKRGLQLHFVAHFSHQFQSMETAFQAWWCERIAPGDEGEGATAAAAAAAEEEDEMEEGDQEPDSSAPVPYSPVSHTRRRTATASLSPAQREEMQRQRAELREQLTNTLLADEEKEFANKQELRRQSRSYSRSSTRGGDSNGAPPPTPSSRRSTLLLTSRGNNEQSALPSSSFRSLPPASPTPLIFKTVKRLHSLAEGDEHEAMGGAGGAAEAVGEEKKAETGPAAGDLTPPLRNGSPASDTSESSSLAFSSDDSDEDDEDHALSALPLADEDDCDPEVALTLPSRPSLSQRHSDAMANTAAAVASTAALGDLSAGGRQRTPTLDNAFMALAAVSIDEEDEERWAPQTSSLSHIDESRASSVSEMAVATTTSDLPAMDFYVSAEFSDSSDEDYEEVALRMSVVSRLSAVTHKHLPGAPRKPLTEEAKLLAAMAAADAAAEQALAEAAALAAAENARLEREQKQWETDCGDMIDHGRMALPIRQSFCTLHRPVATTAGPMRLAQLATQVMQAVRPVKTRPPRRVRFASAVQASTVGGRSRSGTTFASNAAHTPSFIRALQLAKLFYAFDLDFTAVLTALQYSYGCSKQNLHAVVLFAPKGLFSMRLSPYHCKASVFHYLEVCKPRYSRDWLSGLWHLNECYKSMNLLQKARDCLEELRLIAVRQKTEGIATLIASQIGVAAIHESQLCSGRVAKFGSWIDNDNAATLPADSAGAGGSGGATPGGKVVGFSVSKTEAYPHSTPVFHDPTLAHSVSPSASPLAPAESFSEGLASKSLMLPLLATPHANQARLHAILDAIIECYERALFTLESSSMSLLSAAVEAAGEDENGDSRVHLNELGMHAFNRPLLFLLLRLSTFYTYKGAYQNALNMLRRGLEIKSAEVAFRKERTRARREKNATRPLAQRQSVMMQGIDGSSAASSGGGRFGGSSGGGILTSLSSLLPFSLPSSTRLIVLMLFALGLVHFRAGDLDEALAYFERARLVQARLVARRYRREKCERDASWGVGSDRAAKVVQLPSSPTAPLTNAEEAATAEVDAADTAWTLSIPFLSSLATPAQAADVMTYVRCVYMLACTHDRLAQAMQMPQPETAAATASSSSSSSMPAPAPILTGAALASSSFHVYRALVLRSSIVGIWHRVASGHKIVSFHSDLFKVATGMSVLDTA